MRINKISLSEKPVFSEKPFLFLVTTVLITLTVSFPLFSPLLFAVFPSVFMLIYEEKTGKQIIILFSLVLTVCLIVFAGTFFIQSQFFLFLLASLYFTVLLGSDLFIAFYASKHRYALFLIFCYTALSRFILILSTVFFPSGHRVAGKNTMTGNINP
jgi:hypothetical protein